MNESAARSTARQRPLTTDVMEARYGLRLLLPLSDDEKLALVAGLKRLIDEDRYPLSPRVRTLEAILARLQPPKPAPVPPRKH